MKILKNNTRKNRLIKELRDDNRGLRKQLYDYSDSIFSLREELFEMIDEKNLQLDPLKKKISSLESEVADYEVKYYSLIKTLKI